MKETENTPIKIKKALYNNIIQAVFVSFFTTLFVISAIFLLILSHKTEVVSFLTKEYKSQQKIIPKFNIPKINKKVKKEITSTIKKIDEKVPTVVEAVKEARPAVVSIIISKKTDNGIKGRKIGSGSGFLISSGGLIITNSHVVSEKNININVLLNNGKEYEATILDRDPVLDVAFVKIKGSGFPYLKLADSSDLNIGQTVIAIGNALGKFKNTVSVGVISGLSRSISASNPLGQTEFLDKVIQTDAAINLGNSGGPLLNILGNVVGINVALVEGSSNIGFSLPINSIKEAISSVEKTGRIIRPYLGIRYVVITPQLQTRNNLLYNYGIWIQKGAYANEPAVLPNSPAEKAGLKAGDIILSIDGKKIAQNNDFSLSIRNKKIGDFIMMKVFRKGVVKTMVAVLKQVPDNYN